MESSIRDYVSDGAHVRYEQLKTRFGDPKQIASTYVSEMESGDLLNELKAEKKIIRIVFTSVAIAVTLWTALVVTSYTTFKKDINGYAVVEVIEVERTTVDEGGQ